MTAREVNHRFAEVVGEHGKRVLRLGLNREKQGGQHT